MTGKKILVIDDNPDDLAGAKEILELEEYEIHTLESAFGATNIIKDLKPDLILLDVAMPGLDGEAFSRILKSNRETRDIPVVFYSAKDEHTLSQLFRKIKNAGYICKGDPTELKIKVRKYLSRAAMSGEPEWREE